ncbi:MAG: rane protein [Candidatus Saccharibacteria bacterium]|nr:rane protein [Candidatus Saccharibacteria bacterium]
MSTEKKYANNLTFLGKQLLNKVPEITIFFWIIKILCTTVGETAADFLNMDLNFGLTLTTYVMSALMLIILAVQVMSKKYIAGLYWLVVVFISVVGTLITDNLTDNLGVSLQTSSIVFSIILAAVFAGWYWSEKTLSIHSIRTRKRELFYWATILFTFALGTAVGDLIAEQFSVGYLLSIVLFGVIIAAVTVAHYKFKLNAVLAFWIAYILTRPFGASFGDLLSQPTDAGGLGLGVVGTSAIFLVLIVLFVGYLVRTKKDVISDTSIATQKPS